MILGMNRVSSLATGGVSFLVTVLRLAHSKLLVVICLLWPIVAAGQGLFRSPFSTSAIGKAVAIDTGDVDRNGSIDAVIALTDGAARACLNPNNGQLTCCARKIILSGAPSAVLLAHFDADTIPDLVVADIANHRLQFLAGVLSGEGCSNVSFVAVPEVDLATDQNPISLASAFLDEDEHRDLVVASRGLDTSAGSLLVFRGRGDGNFQRVSQPVEGGGMADLLETDDETRGVAITDLDNDGIPDLLAVNAGADSLSIFLGNGDATFRLSSTIATGRGPVSLAAAFLDEDDNVDIVTADRSDDSVSIFLGRGDGSFGERSAHSVGVFPESVATADMDGDGFTDVVTSNRGSFDVSVLLGDGHGALSPARSFLAEEEPTAVLLADLGGSEVGQGRVDVVTITANETVTTLMNRGDGSLDAVENVAVGAPTADVAVADLNDDALPDLVVATASGVVLTFVARASGGFLASQSLSIGGEPFGVVAVDLDRDEYIDIAVADRQLDRVAVAFGKGGGRFGSFQFLSTAPEPVAITAGDFNRDGRVDLAVAAGDKNGQVSVLLHDPGRRFRAARNRAVGAEPIAIVSGAFDADGFDDLAVANNASSNVVILQSNGNGFFRQAQVLENDDVPANPISLALGDFDADGLVDLAIGGFITMSNAAVVAFGNGDGTFQAISGLRFGVVARSLVARDFSGDQIADIASVNPATNQLLIAVSSGNRSFQNRPAQRVSRLPIALSAGDFDGDGRYDAVTANNAGTSRNVSVLWNCARDSGCANDQDVPGAAALRGDGNGDGRRSAADVIAVVAEVRDGDGYQVEGIARSRSGGFAAGPGVDANGDGQIDVQDRTATLRYIFAPPRPEDISR
jgi:hypothetical protein